MKLPARALLLVTLFVATRAAADLPPPAGKKQVDYAFEVSGLGSFGDWVLLAHPYRESVDGVTRAFVRLEDGKRMRVDRRNGTPKLYAMKKQAFETWLSKYQPAKDPSADPAVAALFGSDQVVACDQHPEPVSVVDESDPRSVVVEAFRAKTIDAKTCQLEAGAGAAQAVPVRSAVPAVPPATTPAEPAAPAEPPLAPKRSGCGGCAASSARCSGAGLLAMLVGLLLAGCRSRRNVR